MPSLSDCSEDFSDTEKHQENVAYLPVFRGSTFAKFELDRDEFYTEDGIFGGFYDQTKVTRQQKRRRFNLLDSPKQRRVIPIVNYALSEIDLSEDEDVICRKPQEKPHSSDPSSMSSSESSYLSANPIVPTFHDQFKNTENIHQSLELNALIGHILKQAHELNLGLKGRDTPNDKVLRQKGWTAPKDQLLFLEQLNDATLSPLFDKSARVRVISQGLEEQNQVLMDLLNDLKHSNSQFLNAISENQV